jgi:hypothetical protein
MTHQYVLFMQTYCKVSCDACGVQESDDEGWLVRSPDEPTQASTIQQPMTTAAPSARALPKTTSKADGHATTTLTPIVIGVLVATVLLLVCFAMVRYWLAYKLGKVRVPITSLVSNAFGGGTPGVPMLAEKEFHFFVSHKKKHSTCGDADESLALYLHEGLGHMGFKGFFDVDDLESISKQAIVSGVNACCTLLVVLSDETCLSEWCRLEWTAAQNAGIPIVGVVDVSKFSKDAIIQNVMGVNSYVLNFPVIEYSKQSRKACLQKVARWITKRLKHDCATPDTGDISCNHRPVSSHDCSEELPAQLGKCRSDSEAAANCEATSTWPNVNLAERQLKQWQFGEDEEIIESTSTSEERKSSRVDGVDSADSGISRSSSVVEETMQLIAANAKPSRERSESKSEDKKKKALRKRRSKLDVSVDPTITRARQSPISATTPDACQLPSLLRARKGQDGRNSRNSKRKCTDPPLVKGRTGKRTSTPPKRQATPLQ